METRKRANLHVHLPCPTTTESFEFVIPSDPDWLAEHWNRKTKVRCRECGSAHAYSFRDALLTQMLSFEERIIEIADTL
jgi:hypothetical protein